MTNSVAGAGFGQPRFSRDSIAEFEFVTNRFDATQGRSMGVIVNAVTKSGTNTLGHPLGIFPRLRLGGEEILSRTASFRFPIQHTARHTAGRFGGTVSTSSETTNTSASRRPPFTTAHTRHSTPTFMERACAECGRCEGGLPVHATNAVVESCQRIHAVYAAPRRRRRDHPSSGASQWWRTSSQYWNQLTQVLSNNKVNEIKAGYYLYDWDIRASVRSGRSATQLPRWHLSNRQRPHDARRICGGGKNATLGGTPRIQLSGYNIGTPTNLPQVIGQKTWQIRDDFTASLERWGRHDMRMGGEFLKHNLHFDWCSFCNGMLQATTGGAARRPRHSSSRCSPTCSTGPHGSTTL